jgi:methyl-accepting chemotaxis protein
MTRFITGGIRGKLIASFILVAIIPLAVCGFLSFLRFKGSLENAEYDKLQLLWNSKQHEIVRWFRDIAEQVLVLSQIVRVRNGLEVLAIPDRNPEQVKQAEGELSQVMQSFLGMKTQADGFDDMLLLDAKTGKIYLTAKRLSELGNDVKTGGLKDTRLADAWTQAVTTRRVSISDFGIYPPTGTPSAFVAAPIFHTASGELLGVLAVRLNAQGISRILALEEGAGKTAEIYVVGKDLLMRCQSRLAKESTVLTQKVDTDPIKRAQGGRIVRFEAKSYRGEPNLAVAGAIGLDKQKAFAGDFDWVMVSEVDVAEALQPVKELAYWAALVAGAAILAVVLAAVFLARGITGPIVLLSDAARKVSGGDLTVELPELSGRDEVSALGEAFRLMMVNMRAQVSRLREGVTVLTLAVGDISSTASQVATSTSQTSSAVGETAVTMEEVKQAARLAWDRAKNVVETAQEAFDVSEGMKTATEDRVQRINLIRDQMESIGDTVVRLSDHSREIEEIIGTVQDLADQSNLLAVNASIEAARAGEQGKGFAVVAHEIKTLADQSRQATQQVRGILSDTRKWVSAVVMAAEQGSKAVQAGVEQSRTAGEAIVRFSESMTASSQAARIIETTIEQQFAGVGQVANAMTSIDQAMHQTVEATTQLSDAAKRLSHLGEQLKEVVQSYKV